MRRTTEIVICLGLASFAPACTSHRLGTPDASHGAEDAGRIALEAGAHDAGGAVPDASMPHDASAGHDAFIAPGHDAASGGHDAFAPDAWRMMCPTAIDVSAGGMFTIATCASTDHFASACGTTGAHDVIVFATEVGSATQIAIAGDTGWLIQQLSPTCTTGLGGTTTCSTAGTWSSAGSDGSPRFYWGIERVDGTCETTQIMVTRTP